MASQTTGGKPEPIRSSQKLGSRLRNSLVAAATRLKTETVRRTGRNMRQDWQQDAWDLFDLVGEQHFLATTLANRLGQARLYVGKLTDDPTEPPEPVEDGQAAEVFAGFGGSQGTRAQLIARLGLNLFVAGDGWLVGIPRHLLPGTDDAAIEPDPDSEFTPVEILALSDLEWRMLSVSEVAFDNTRVTLKFGESTEDQTTVWAEDIFLIRVWRPHPRRWWEADSPTRASLPVLRELVGLTEHVSAQVDSRLAGAGVFVVPQSATDALLSRSGAPEDDESDQDPFTENLMDAMLTPIKDRSNASAFVPLVLSAPDEAAEKFRHISFASPLDSEARELRDEAIRRLALGQDAPPELLLGVGDMNHWGGWLVREDTVTTHIEPPLTLMCDALTTQFLRPVLIQQGMSPDEAAEYVIWYDVSHLIQRPNRVQDAQQAHAAGVISDEAYRDVLGFSDTDAPQVTGVDPAVTTALELVQAAPSLVQQPGLPALVEQIRQVMSGEPVESVESVPADEAPADDGERAPRPPSQTINDVDLPDDTDTPPATDGYVIKAPDPITMPPFPIPAGRS